MSLKPPLTSFILFICSILPGHSQHALSGSVSDSETGMKLPGVTVYLHDLKKGTITDTSGYFHIDGLRSGKFIVEFKLIGYTPVIQSVQIDGSTEIVVSLASSVTELHEVIVTGISQSTELRKNPVPITTVNNQFLTENVSTNLIDNLSRKPGISQITTGTAIAKPVIRGLGYNRIITLNDGNRQEGQQWGDEHGIEIDEFSVDRVEVVKGAGSLMYGSDGLGGVINFLPPKPAAPGTLSARWVSNYQTNSGLIGNSLSNNGNLNGIYWLIRASNKIAKAYENKFDGKVFNSGFHELNFNGMVGISRKWGYSELSVSSFNQSVGLVEGDRDANGNFIRSKNENGAEEEATVSDDELNSYRLFIPNQTIGHTRISNTSNFYFQDSRLQLTMGYQRNQRKEFGSVMDEHEAELFFDLRTSTLNLIYFFPAVKGWEFSAGTSSMIQQNQNRGLAFVIPEYKSYDWGAFVFTKKQFKKLDVAAGVRYDTRTLNSDALYLDADGNPTQDPSMTEKFKEEKAVFNNYSASAGATYEFSKRLVGKVNVSRGFRAPALSELASNGQHEGAFRYEYGDFNLHPETSLQLDASVLLNSTHVTLEVAAFQNALNNYIYTEKLLASDGTDSIPDPTNPSPAFQYTQGKAMLRGGELTLDIHPHPLDWLHFENSFSFVLGKNQSSERDSSQYLPFIPAPRLQSELRVSFKKIGAIFSSTFLKLELTHSMKQDHVLLENRTETPTPSFTLFNVGAGTAIRSKKDVELFSLYFTVANLFDKAYQNHLSRLKYAAVNPVTGRTGVFNVGRNFSFKIVVPVTWRKGESD